MSDKKIFRILTINPGSTSTAVAVFRDENEIFTETIRHSADELKKFPKLMDQHVFREELILGVLRKNRIFLSNLDAIVGRGGILRPLSSGTYRINQIMLEELNTRPRVEHASNLGALIAYNLAKKKQYPFFYC